jgi:hypothetical protein
VLGGRTEVGRSTGGGWIVRSSLPSALTLGLLGHNPMPIDEEGATRDEEIRTALERHWSDGSRGVTRRALEPFDG